MEIGRFEDLEFGIWDLGFGIFSLPTVYISEKLLCETLRLLCETLCYSFLVITQSHAKNPQRFAEEFITTSIFFFHLNKSKSYEKTTMN
jgi:hypothetical protein